MIRANDIEKRVLTLDAELLKKGEDRIDQKIDSDWQPGETVSVEMPKEYPKRVIKALADMYGSAENGWLVDVTGDNYGGGHTFKLQKRPLGNPQR